MNRLKCKISDIWEWAKEYWLPIILVVIILVVFLGAFIYMMIPPKIDSGIVIDKEYRSAHSTMILMPMQSGDITIMIPYYIHHPERWSVVIEGQDTKGDVVTQRFWISQHDYNNIELSQYISFRQLEATTEEPHERVRA